MRRLYYFSDAYPFSVDYTWKSAEIKAAAEVFEEVVIVPFSYRRQNQFTFPANVRVEQPTLGKNLFAKPKYLWRLFAISQPQNWISELFRALPRGKHALVSWYLATIYSHLIIQKPVFNELEKLKEKDNAVLFFQWTMNNALLAPRLKKWGFKHIVCRMHGFDLYEFRHDGYLPYKAAILKAASACTFISKHGKEYAEKKYPFIRSKSFVHFLGANPFPKNELMPNEPFHLMSISRAVPLKRLDLILEAVKGIDYPIKWTHIGDGPIFKRLQKDAEALMQRQSNAEIQFTGWLNPLEIKNFVQTYSINALVLVSETEGLPVAIMEAFSAGIPVIATDVGGVSELVNQENGILLEKNPSIGQLIKAIEGLMNEQKESIQKRREAAHQKYMKKLHLNKNSREFIFRLKDSCR